MAELDYAKVIGRFGITVIDSADGGDDPDTIWCDEGSIRLTPLITYTKFQTATPVPATLGQSVIDAIVDDQGYLSWNGLRYVKVVDLTSEKLNPRISDGKATHRVEFRNVKAAGTVVAFETQNVRIVSGVDNDLTVLLPVPIGQGTAIVVGPTGPAGPNSIPTAEFMGSEIATDGTPANDAIGAVSGIIVANDAEADALAPGSWAIVLGTPPVADTTPPTTPTALVATPGNGKVDLSWGASTDNVGGLEYVVRRDGTVISTQVTLAFTDTGRTNGTSYSYTVTAVDGAGNASAPTSPATATPAPTVPAQITDVLAVSAGSGAYNLSWTAPNNGGSAITDYKVEYRADSGSWVIYADGTSTTATAALTGLSVGPVYTFRVSAINAVGTGAASVAVKSRVNLFTVNQATIETDLTGLTTGGAGTTISRTTVDKKSGTASLLLTQAAASGISAYAAKTSGIVGGQTYSGLVSLKGVSVALPVYINLVWLNSVGTSVGTSAGATVAGSSTAFVNLAVTAVAPATATQVRVQFGVPSANAPTTGPALYADEIGLFDDTVPAGGWVTP